MTSKILQHVVADNGQSSFYLSIMDGARRDVCSGQYAIHTTDCAIRHSRRVKRSKSCGECFMNFRKIFVVGNDKHSCTRSLYALGGDLVRSMLLFSILYSKISCYEPFVREYRMHNLGPYNVCYPGVYITCHALTHLRLELPTVQYFLDSTDIPPRTSPQSRGVHGGILVV